MSLNKSHLFGFLSGAFISAGFAFAPHVTSSSSLNDQAKEIISVTVKESLSAALAEIDKKDQERIDNIPDILNCNTFHWMKNCEEVNEQAKLNPSAHLRIKNKDGVEFNFAPDTPSAYMEFALNPTPETAEKWHQALDSFMGHMNKANAVSNMQFLVRGGYESAPRADGAPKSRTEYDLPFKDLTINVFGSSTCSYCFTYIKRLKNLKKEMPGLQVAIFQFDHKSNELVRRAKEAGFFARKLTKQEIAKVGPSILKSPTTWVDNKRTKNRITFYGLPNFPQVISMLEQAAFENKKG